MNERDKELAKEAWQKSPGWQEGYVNIPKLIALIRANEREACAVLAQQTICDTHISTGINIYGTRAAAAIRARGNT
jgi:hypothetical protein